jgi:hypothetical protein
MLHHSRHLNGSALKSYQVDSELKTVLSLKRFLEHFVFLEVVVLLLNLDLLELVFDGSGVEVG